MAANIRGVKITSPDVRSFLIGSCDYIDTHPDGTQYKGWSPEKAMEDYWSRIKTHEKNYEPVQELNWPYIKIINVSALPIDTSYIIVDR